MKASRVIFLLPCVWVALLGSNLRAQPAPEPASMPASAPARGLQVDLLYTGRTGGVANTSATGWTILLLWRYLAEHHGSATLDRSGRILQRGTRVLLDPEEFRSSRALQLLSDPQVTARVLAERLPVLESENVLVVQYPPDPDLDVLSMMEEQNRRDREDPTLQRREGRLVEYRTRTGRRFLSLDAHPSASLALDRDPLAWETSWAARGGARLGERSATYYLFPKAQGDGARRAAHLTNLRAQIPRGQTLLLSAGNEVDTFDALTGERSPYRDLDFQVLGSLRYAAIVPGGRELYFGLEELRGQVKRHGLAVVATNLYRKKGAEKGPPVFSRYLLRQVGGIRVGIIGLVSPDIGERIRDPDIVSDIQVVDPVEAATQAIAEMRGLAAARPDLVVALSNLRDQALTDFLAESHGVDIFIGDAHRGGLHPPRQELDARSRKLELHISRDPVLEAHASQIRVGHIGARFLPSPDGPYLDRLIHEQRAITSDLPRSEWIHRQRRTIGGRGLEAREAVMVPPLETILESDARLLQRVHEDPDFLRAFSRRDTERWQVWFTPRLWSHVTANLLRSAAGAEVALVKETTQLGFSTPGPVLEEYVASWSASEDMVAIYELTGAQLRHLAQARREGMVLTGLDPEAMLVGGRRLSDTERYRVVLGRSVTNADPVTRVLRGIDPETHFVLEKGRLRESRRGRVVRLREIVMTALREMRTRDPEFGSAYRARMRSWLMPQGKELLPRWSLRADDVAVSFASYGNYPRQSWLHEYHQQAGGFVSPPRRGVYLLPSPRDRLRRYGGPPRCETGRF